MKDFDLFHGLRYSTTVTVYRAFRDFIYLFMFIFFHERKGVACSQISIRSLFHVHL